MLLGLGDKMKARPLLVLLVLSVSSLTARADCDVNFGNHQPPADPLWAPPVEDPPFASFEWGTDARRDASRRWWGLNVIKNGANGPRLVVDWKKGGIFLPLGTPLDQGKPHCRSDLLGVELPPILDQDAPIIYSSNRRQNAAVYVANSQAQNAPGAIREPPSAATRIETTYRDQGGRDRDVHVFIDSESFGNSPEARTISVSVQKNPELTVGISELADLVDADQMGAIQRTFRGQGFTVELATLAEFAGQDALKDLFWAEGSEAPKGKVLFLSGGEKGGFSYRPSGRSSVKETKATLFIFDSRKRAIAADRITLIVPQ
jgi:hypothetical protein